MWLTCGDFLGKVAEVVELRGHGLHGRQLGLTLPLLGGELVADLSGAPSSRQPRRAKVGVRLAMVVPDLPGGSFEAALGLVAIGHVGSNFGQLCALAGHHAAAERRKGDQVSGDCACWLARIVLC